MKALILLFSSFLVVSGCESTRLASQSGVGADESTKALRQVVGLWEFSHAGAPTIQSSKLQGVDVTGLMEQQMKGAKFSIDENGEASSTVGGMAGTFRVKIVEETPIYIKISSTNEGVETVSVYDKADEVIVMQSPMTVNEDSKGTIPIYFKRR